MSRLQESLAKAREVFGIDPETVTNVFFVDYFVSGEHGASRLRYSGDVVHSFDAAGRVVTEYRRLRDLAEDTDEDAVMRYRWLAPDGFVSTQIGAIPPFEPEVDRSRTEAASFLAGRTTRIEIHAVFGGLFGARSLQSAEGQLSVPFLERSATALCGPLWLSAFVDTASSAVSINLRNARTGAVLYGLTATVPLYGLTQLGLFASVFSILPKVFAILLLIAGLVGACLALPELAGVATGGTIWGFLTSGTASALTFWSSTLGLIGSLVQGIYDWICENTSNAPPAWQQERDEIQAKVDEAHRQAEAAGAAGDRERQNAALEAEKKALEDLKRHLNDPSSGMSEEATASIQASLQQSIDAVQDILNLLH